MAPLRVCSLFMHRRSDMPIIAQLRCSGKMREVCYSSNCCWLITGSVVGFGFPARIRAQREPLLRAGSSSNGSCSGSA